MRVVSENAFGNLILEDTQGKFWRLCPEDLYCEVVAASQVALDTLLKDPEFLEDWYMRLLVERTQNHLGEPGEGDKYCLVTPGPLGGEYGVANIKTAPLIEIIRLSGDIAFQIKDLEDGAKIRFKLKK